MTIQRRQLLKGAAGLAGGTILGGALAACSPGGTTTTSSAAAASSAGAGAASGVTFLFVHGAWHAAMHWNRVVAGLNEQGHRALAIDLPGTGLNLLYPPSYLTQDLDAFNTEASPMKGWGIDKYVDPTVETIKNLGADGGKVILVGHSFGGLTITKAAQTVPDLIERVVYLTAYCPVKLGSAAEYNSLPENAPSLSGTVQFGDPGVTGAVRINPKLTDPEYLERDGRPSTTTFRWISTSRSPPA